MVGAMSRILMVITTRSLEEAEAIGKACVERKLAASAQIEPIAKTIYRYKGEIHSHAEARLTLLTRQTCAEAIISLVRELHSYELPQIIALPIAAGLTEFLGWIDENTGDAEDSRSEAP